MFSPMYSYRLQNSNKLENSIQNCKSLLAPYENRLAREEIAPSDPSSLDRALRELAVRCCLHTSPLLQTLTVLYMKHGFIQKYKQT